MIVEELHPVPDPLEACARCADLPFVLLLESASRDEHLGRYSFLTADPSRVVRNTRALTQEWTEASDTWTRVNGDPLDVARGWLTRFAAAAVPGLPPFQGGAAGYLGYDWGANLERVPRSRYQDLEIPDAMLGLYDWVIAWDHLTESAWIISTGMPHEGPAASAYAAERMARVKQRLRAPARLVRHGAAAGDRHMAPSYPVAGVPAVRSTFTKPGYLSALDRVIAYIRAGDIFQANLSQRFQASLAGTPLELYARLRRRNPAPFAAYFAGGGFVVASSSPERFLRVNGGHVEARPIKGTRPRGIGPEHDAALALALTESDKDRAENVMIVDLLRNDLSRVCRPTTVRAPELFALEHYATVHHLVSTVVGDLAPGRDAADLLRAAFPGGSITGAPKVRAMQIIAELEPTERAVYCGSLGYLSRSGAADTSIVIRTYLILGEDVYFQAGGGIVADSDPEQEYEETLAKAQALFEALVP